MSQEQKILMMSILSLIGCSILGPFAWMQANKALDMIDYGGYEDSERSLVAAGQVCGMIGTGLLMLEIVYFLLCIVTGGHMLPK